MESNGLEFDTKAVLTGVTKDNLIVKFFYHEEESMFSFNEDGTPKKTMHEFVSIKIPGSDDDFCSRVRDSDKIRFAGQYNAWKAGQEGLRMVEGFPITKWSRVTESKREVLKALGFHTVEQLASCSDSLINRVGFDGHTLRREAIKFLADNKNARIEDTVLAKEDLERKLEEANQKLLAMATINESFMKRLEALETKKVPPSRKKVSE